MLPSSDEKSGQSFLDDDDGINDDFDLADDGDDDDRKHAVGVGCSDDGENAEASLN